MRDKLFRKFMIVCAICILMLVSFSSYNGKTVDNLNEYVLLSKEEGNGVFKWGFVIGPIGLIQKEDDDIYLLTVGKMRSWRDPLLAVDMNVIVFFPPYKEDLIWEQQIRIQFKYGYLSNTFIIAFCRIYMLKSEISMHVVSHDDLSNEVCWEIDAIDGDPIWENNIDIDLFDESGELHGSSYGPLGAKYLSVGKQICITPIEGGKPVDGYYYFTIIEELSKNILFKSDLIKY